MKDFHDFVIDIAMKDNVKLAEGFKEAYKADNVETLFKWFQENGYGKISKDECKKLVENEATVEGLKENIVKVAY